jgi:alkanesulfonate monooxygenase SsuD/methylene tetrahydromethanopterin reductase-like flavin-dependent oxidoreductase (luciferase family)
MKIGLVADGGAHTRHVIALAQLAETYGIDEFWLTEDYFERGAFAVAGAVLATTSTVAVGIGVVNPWTRHPVLTAMETAALTEVGPGRVILGLGASNQRWMQMQLGIPFERPISRLEESVGVIRALLAGEHVRRETLGGMVDAQLAFVPERPVPIALGVKGPRALDLGRRIADSILLSTLSSPAYIRWVRERVGDDVPLAAYVAGSCGTDRHAARERVRPFIAKYLGVHGRHDITRIAGIDADLADKFRAGWVDGQPRTDLVDDALIDLFTLAGDAQDIAAGVGRLANKGLSTLVLQDRGGAGTNGLVRLLEAARAAGGLRSR